MRPSRFTEVQVRQALQQVTDGTPAAHVCREYGITQTTFYRWRRKHEDSASGESREMRDLREENLRLKQLVADLLLKSTRLEARKGR
jgi:putative transposase